jgi:hypothetical protein
LKTEATPVLRSMAVTWLPENTAPVIRRVGVGEPGTPRPKGTSTTEGPAKESSSTLWLSWASSDANGDALRHTISIRRSEETEWRVLAREVKEPPYGIDAAALPEGRYVAKVVADDEEANGTERALQAEGRSEPFNVDRTPPVISPSAPEESGGTLSIRFSVRDALSTVSRAEWGPEAEGPWTNVMARDGIADTPSEEFLARISASDARRRIFLRATDSAGNVSTLEVTLSRSR